MFKENIINLSYIVVCNSIFNMSNFSKNGRIKNWVCPSSSQHDECCEHSHYRLTFEPHGCLPRVDFGYFLVSTIRHSLYRLPHCSYILGYDTTLSNTNTRYSYNFSATLASVSLLARTRQPVSSAKLSDSFM